MGDLNRYYYLLQFSRHQQLIFSKGCTDVVLLHEVTISNCLYNTDTYTICNLEICTYVELELDPIYEQDSFEFHFL
jgi:hypothetical protein